MYHLLHIMLDNEVITVRKTMEIPLKEFTAQWVVGQINRDDNTTESKALCKHIHHICIYTQICVILYVKIWKTLCS